MPRKAKNPGGASGARPGQFQKSKSVNAAPLVAELANVPALPLASVEPLFHTYDVPKPDGAWFDEDAADKAVDFIQGLNQYQGIFGGHPLTLLPWQVRFVRELFGWRRPDGARLYRTAYLEVPRKAGKSTLAAAIGLYLAYGDGEPGPQVYFAAADKDQAKVCYNAARVMAEANPELAEATAFYNSRTEMLLRENPGGVVKALSSDIAKQYGLNIHGLVFDELMTQRNREMWDALTTSMGARRQPLTVAISTAGWNRNSVCYELRSYANDLAAGSQEDPTFLGVVYSIDEAADWTLEESWTAANPSLGYTVPLDYYVEHSQRAQAVPAYQNTFRTLLLSQWVGQETRYIPMDKWDAAPEPLEPRGGDTAFGGLDLASTTDLASFALVFPREDGFYDERIWYFMPAEDLRERGFRDRVPYDVWVRDGHIIATPGNVIDYAYIKQVIREACELYRVKDISYDRWGAIQMAQELEADGITMVQMGQGFASMSSPTKEMLRLVMDGKLRHGGHPVLRWNVDNAAAKVDEAGNVKLDKSKSAARIDGAVATVMALDGALRRGQVRKSVYETRGLFSIDPKQES